MNLKSCHFTGVSLLLLLCGIINYVGGTPGANDVAPPITPDQGPGVCVWYGQCGKNPGKGLNGLVNCMYRGAPKPFNTTEGINAFKNVCPDFYNGDDTPVCCSDSQMITLNSQISVPKQAFNRCPSCLRNFLALWCHFTCSANQSLYMNANETAEYKHDGVVKTSITKVDYSVSPEFAYGMYNSCMNVQSPSSNQPALSLLCGVDKDKCSPQAWLDFMGNTENTQSPFDIQFHITNDNITYTDGKGNNFTNMPMNWKTYKCQDAPSVDSLPCSCPDCPKSCQPIPPVPQKPGPCEIFHVDCADFAFTIVFAGFLLVFGIFTICYNIVIQDSLRLEQPGKQEEAGCCGLTAAAANRNRRKEERLRNVTANDLGAFQRVGGQIEAGLEKMFQTWGKICVSHPWKVIISVLLISGVLCAGITFFKVTTNPVKLWSGPESRARTEKNYFDEHFVPFYRTEQLIITQPNNKTVVKYQPSVFQPADNFTSLFDKNFMHEMLDLQQSIENLTVEFEGETIGLPDICFKPLSPDNNNCTIQSVFNYFQNSHEILDKTITDPSDPWARPIDYLDHLSFCVTSPVSIQDTKFLEPCLATFGGPVFPWIAFGGYEGVSYNTSQAFVITFVVNNHVDEAKNKKAEAWESKFVSFMKNYTATSTNVTISFSSERSIEDEIDRESASDVMTILVSYLIMFGYITIMLGRYRSIETIFVDSKVVLGIAGVFIVLISVGASLGFYSYIGIPSTLIIVEVVPFLVLAVGVDNIFILVQTYQREKRSEGESVEDLIVRVVGKVGPSMLLTSSSESLAFFLGALTDMPAVKIFSLYAAGAVLFDFLLQITMFISLVYLDAKREEKNRMDLCCCLPPVQEQPVEPCCGDGILFTLVSEYYSHFIMKEYVRPFVMIIFVGVFCCAGALTCRLEIGLDQSLSMPKDSYVLDYFGNLSAYLSVGAPVYFVVRDGHDYASYEGQNQVCGVAGCSQTSVVQQINQAALTPNYSRIAQPVSSWLDDYFSWLVIHPCCRTYEDDANQFCPSTEVNKTCEDCNITTVYKGRPVNQDFNKFLPWFLKDNPGLKCAKGGHAAYGSGVELLDSNTRVGATYFMTYHTILKTSADYIDALKQARRVADNITLSMNGKGEVFPYSVFYVFYEQYLTIERDAALNIAYCLIGVFIISFLLLGLDLYSAVMIVITILMILVDQMGFMYLWDIDLNALSLVNLIMSLGIGVEFCSHIVRAFAISTRSTRKERAKDALGHMGGSVLSGITLTKLVGISILAFSKSQLFQVFYFRMYLGMVIFGATHGLIFLPVFLSYVGPPVNKSRVYLMNQAQQIHESSISVNSPDRKPGEVYDSPPAHVRDSNNTYGAINGAGESVINSKHSVNA